MCLQQSSTNSKTREAGTEESSLPQHGQCILLCSGPRLRSPEAPQQPLLPGHVQLAAHTHSSHVMGLTFPLALSRQTPSCVTLNLEHFSPLQTLLSALPHHL